MWPTILNVVLVHCLLQCNSCIYDAPIGLGKGLVINNRAGGGGGGGTK